MTEQQDMGFALINKILAKIEDYIKFHDYFLRTTDIDYDVLKSPVLMELKNQAIKINQDYALSLNLKVLNNIGPSDFLEPEIKSEPTIDKQQCLSNNVSEDGVKLNNTPVDASLNKKNERISSFRRDYFRYNRDFLM